jgi:phosphoenolpyruvate phosphomutase
MKHVKVMTKKKNNGQSAHAEPAGDSSNLFDGRFQVGIGVYDGLSALLAAKCKFYFMWVSSFCCSAAVGLPDAGIIGPEDILNVVRCVRRCVDAPIVVDLDSGYGDAVKVFHVIEAMARAGAAGLCIEDNPVSKRCSLYDGYARELASVEEHISRLRAATAGVKAARSNCKIIARTEALVAGQGVAEALKRAHAYADAGAHGVFIQSLDATGNEVLSFGRQWKRRTPLFIAPTRLPHVTRKDFEAAGISHSIFANQGLRAAHAAMDQTFGKLAQAESAECVVGGISSIATVANLVGAQEVVELEAMLAGKAAAGTPKASKAQGKAGGTTRLGRRRSFSKA